MKIIDTFHRLIGRGMPVPDSAVIPCGIISPEEMRAVAASFDIYRGAAPWLLNGGCGLELASGISSELARLTLTEFSCGFQRSRAGRFLENALSPFLSRLRIYTEYACMTGRRCPASAFCRLILFRSGQTARGRSPTARFFIISGTAGSFTQGSRLTEGPAEGTW